VITYKNALAALADGTRRTILEALKTGPKSVGELAAQATVSQPAVSQHLKVLREAGLARVHRDGRRHLHSVDNAGLVALRAYLDSFWNEALDAFQAAAEAELDTDKE
jgi:DNA-binding transcriptional ArsR family regulator